MEDGHKGPLRGRAPVFARTRACLGSGRFSQGDVYEGSILSYQSTSRVFPQTHTHTHWREEKAAGSQVKEFASIFFTFRLQTLPALFDFSALLSVLIVLTFSTSNWVFLALKI